jgi:hypothetical protein
MRRRHICPPHATYEEGSGEPAEELSRADAANPRSTHAGRRKCRRDPRTLSYLQNKPMTAQHLTAHIRLSRALRSCIGDEMLKLAGNSGSRHILRRRERKDSHRNDRTMPECDMMSVSGPSSETLSIVKLLATSLTSYRLAKPVFWGIAASRRAEWSSGAASAGRSRLYRDPEQGVHQLLNAATAGPRIAPGNQG